MSSRRLYVPITRSGSSILASVTTQLWQQSARTQHTLRNKKYYDDCPEHIGIYFFIWLIFMFVFSSAAGVLAQHFEWWKTEPAGWFLWGTCAVAFLGTMAYLNHWDRTNQEAKRKQIRDKAEEWRRAEARRIIAMSYGNEMPPEGEVREEWEKWHKK